MTAILEPSTLNPKPAHVISDVAKGCGAFLEFLGPSVLEHPQDP